jgi:hypothetical protein
MLDTILGQRLAGLIELMSKSTTFITGLFSFMALVSIYYTVVFLDLFTPPGLVKVGPRCTMEAEEQGSNRVKDDKNETLIQSGENEAEVEQRIRKERIRKTKMNSWIITSCSSLVMTLGALPFLYDLLASGFDVAAVGRRDVYAQGLCAFFIAYLVAVRPRPSKSLRRILY